MFRKPSAPERIFNTAFGVLLRLGLGLRHNYLLRVRGRKTGRVFATPVDVLELEDRRFLVAPRGRTQWVRNEILSAYLDRFTPTVQRYFPVRAGTGPQAFAVLVDRYPVFELLPADVTG